MRGKDQTKEWLVSEKERFDTDLDRNKDGFLDDAEIGSWIVPSNDEIAQVTFFLPSNDEIAQVTLPKTFLCCVFKVRYTK